MTVLRRCSAAAALGACGAAVMALQWWSLFVVLPGMALAFALDPDR